ncbi:MAG: methyltransferase domain-containing protein [Anaerolineales bacterium]
MPLSIDPSDLELQNIRALARFGQRQVVEIGAGDARLAASLAGDAARWLAFDADLDELRAAADALRAEPLPAVRLAAVDGRALSLPAACCDLAFFSWSLC